MRIAATWTKHMSPPRDPQLTTLSTVFRPVMLCTLFRLLPLQAAPRVGQRGRAPARLPGRRSLPRGRAAPTSGRGAPPARRGKRKRLKLLAHSLLVDVYARSSAPSRRRSTCSDGSSASSPPPPCWGSSRGLALLWTSNF
jgi:hypothetical protein